MRRRDPVYCVGMGGIQKTPWRPTLEMARADAVEGEFATWDADSGTAYMHVPYDIYQTFDLVAAFPRDPKPLIKPPPVEPTLSRIERIIARKEAAGRKAN